MRAGNMLLTPFLKWQKSPDLRLGLRSLLQLFFGLQPNSLAMDSITLDKTWLNYAPHQRKRKELIIASNKHKNLQERIKKLDEVVTKHNHTRQTPTRD
jgi:hypothetical protein